MFEQYISNAVVMQHSFQLLPFLMLHLESHSRGDKIIAWQKKGGNENCLAFFSVFQGGKDSRGANALPY